MNEPVSENQGQQMLRAGGDGVAVAAPHALSNASAAGGDTQ
jgi:hypothetical protein